MKVRTKGHAFERKIAQQFRPFFPEARRHLEYQDGEANGVDIANTGKFKIQCKKHKSYVPINTIKEIKEKGVPLLITAGDHKEPMVVIPLKDFLNLLKNNELEGV